jgi:hypothetical protein
MGTQTANLLASGNSPGGPVAFVESWNGTSWTEVADINTLKECIRRNLVLQLQVLFLVEILLHQLSQQLQNLGMELRWTSITMT